MSGQDPPGGLPPRHWTSPLETRLEQLENPPPANPIVVYKQNERMRNLKKGLSMQDQDLVDRLDHLKR